MTQLLNQSKNNIESETQEKKGRGRPKGTRKTKIPNEVKQETVDPLKYKTALAAVIRFTGEFLASGAKFEGFKFSEDEVEMLAVQGSDVAVEFVPYLDSKWVKLGVFATCTASIYGLKYQAYVQHAKAQEQKAKDDAISVN